MADKICPFFAVDKRRIYLETTRKWRSPTHYAAKSEWRMVDAVRVELTIEGRNR